MGMPLPQQSNRHGHAPAHRILIEHSILPVSVSAAHRVGQAILFLDFLFLDFLFLDFLFFHWGKAPKDLLLEHVRLGLPLPHEQLADFLASER